MNIIDRIAQHRMERKLKSAYGQGTNVERGSNGSLYIRSDAGEVPDWKITGKSDFDKFIKRYGMVGTDGQGQEIPYTMASRGSVEASKNVTMIAPVYKDRWGRKWLIVQEEARPIDVARRGKDARVLAFPAGVIGDEAAFQSETALESAVRELSEETGLGAKKVVNLSPVVAKDGKRVITPVMTSPGLTDESTYFFKAMIDSIKPTQKAVTDGGVTRGWHFVPQKHVMKWLEASGEQGKIASGQTLSALALLNEKVKKPMAKLMYPVIALGATLALLAGVQRNNR